MSSREGRPELATYLPVADLIPSRLVCPKPQDPRQQPTDADLFSLPLRFHLPCSLSTWTHPTGRSQEIHLQRSLRVHPPPHPGRLRDAEERSVPLTVPRPPDMGMHTAIPRQPHSRAARPWLTPTGRAGMCACGSGLDLTPVDRRKVNRLEIPDRMRTWYVSEGRDGRPGEIDINGTGTMACARGRASCACNCKSSSSSDDDDEVPPMLQRQRVVYFNPRPDTR